MKTYQIPGLFTVGILSVYLAYTVIDSLMREFSRSLTYLDLGAIFALGLIAGVALGLAFVFHRKQPIAR
jgi:asparagine N-glycosylation enzyme membrane subunit Stt3